MILSNKHSHHLNPLPRNILKFLMEREGREREDRNKKEEEEVVGRRKRTGRRRKKREEEEEKKE